MAYEGSGAAWACGPSFVYDRMALRVVQPYATRLAGKLVLDAGAGTGAVCRALARAGALPVAFDSSADMLAQVGDAALVAIVGDLCAQPFLDGAFEAAVSAFAISHVDTPERSLAELRRIVKPSGPVIVAVFGAAPRNANKNIVDQLAAQHGPTFRIDAMQLKETLRRIHANADNLVHGRLLSDEVSTNLIMAHRCRSGAVHPNNPSSAAAMDCFALGSQ